MPFTIKGKVEGLGDALKALKGLNDKLRKKTLRKAVNKAGAVIQKRAKQLAPVETKLLRKSLGKKVKVYKSGVAVVVVGPKKGFRREVVRAGRPMTSDPTKYAHLVEGGTKPHKYKTRGGRHPGARAKPFLAPALSSTQATVKKVIANVIVEAIQAAGNGG